MLFREIQDVYSVRQTLQTDWVEDMPCYLMLKQVERRVLTLFSKGSVPGFGTWDANYWKCTKNILFLYVYLYCK
jgi:hypothetical protein